MRGKERQEFIDKFRKEQGLEPLKGNKVNTSTISVSETTIKNKASSGGLNKTTKTYSKGKLENNNSVEELNYSKNIISKESEPKRWDYLHQFEKVKKAKIEHKRQKQGEELDLKFQQECTFNPIFFSKKSDVRSKSKGKIHISKNFGNDNYGVDKNTLNNSGINLNVNQSSSKVHELMHSSSILNNNIIKYNNNRLDNELLSADVNQRTLMFLRKKANKNESMKQQLYDREQQECSFNPKLVRF